MIQTWANMSRSDSRGSSTTYSKISGFPTNLWDTDKKGGIKKLDDTEAASNLILTNLTQLVHILCCKIIKNSGTYEKLKRNHLMFFENIGSSESVVVYKSTPFPENLFHLLVDYLWDLEFFWDGIKKEIHHRTYKLILVVFVSVPLLCTRYFIIINLK